MLSNYVAVRERGTVFADENPVSISDIKDGLSNVIYLVESRNRSVHWMSPVDLTADQFLLDLRETSDAGSANHFAGCWVLLGDGTTRFVKQSLRESTLKALLIRDDGETIGTF